MKKYQWIVFGLAIFTLLPSCVSTKKYNEAQDNISTLQKRNQDLNSDLTDTRSQLKLMEDANKAAASQLNQQDSTLTERQKQLKEQQELLAQQQKRMTELQQIINDQNQKTEALKNRLVSALGNFNAEDLSVYKKDGKVYVRMSEKLLFPSGSALVNKDGIEALGELAKALNENPDINIDVEGHTDTVPIRLKYPDNWELSTARANAIVRILINNYQVNPQRLTSSGRSQYDPVADNTSPEGRTKNRRTEIILAPNLNQLMELLNSDTTNPQPKGN